MVDPRFTWTPFLAYGQKLELKKNTFVYRQGENGRGFYYVDQGGVKIVLLSDNGIERTIDYVPIGALSGEHGAFKGTYLTTAITTSQSVLYYFSDEALSRVCRDHSHAAVIFTNSQIYKIRLLAEIIAYLDSPIEQQMAYFLLKLIAIHENEHVPIDQTSFARYIGTSRITVNKILQKWRQQGLIQLSHRGTIHIIDIDKMKEIVSKPVNMRETYLQT